LRHLEYIRLYYCAVVYVEQQQLKQLTETRHSNNDGIKVHNAKRLEWQRAYGWLNGKRFGWQLTINGSVCYAGWLWEEGRSTVLNFETFAVFVHSSSTV